MPDVAALQQQLQEMRDKVSLTRVGWEVGRRRWEVGGGRWGEGGGRWEEGGEVREVGGWRSMLRKDG